MRVLSALGTAVLLVTAITVGVSMTATEGAAHPPAETDHGVNETTFPTLWSGDADEGSIDRSGNWTAMEGLATGTDIPLNAPPKAVERWNRGDVAEFPRTDRHRSIHPPDATLSGGQFVRDAYAEVFAVQPSTRARISPAEQPLYVASDGRVLGVVDYRIEEPADDTWGSLRRFWTLQSHGIVETRLEVDGQVETRSGGAHTPLLDYSSLDQYRGARHTLSLVAEIEVTFEKLTMTRHYPCETVNNSTVCWEVWVNESSYPTETVTVEDSIEVVEYDLGVSGFTARYPDGDLGLVVYKNHPWLGYSVPNGSVHGVWRFYAARDREWDTLVTSTESGTTDGHSPVHPLQVNAYPIETGPTATPRSVVTILEAYGVEQEPPTLPADVHLDVLTEPYIASYGIATRVQTRDDGLSNVTAYGLVRGVTARADEEPFVEVPINRSELTLTPLNVTEETVTVQVRLRDGETGDPITTADREGYVVLDGERVNTSGNGTVTRVLSRSSDGISARYEPGRWWYDRPGYVGDSDVVYVRGTILDTVSVVYRMLVPVSLFLLGVFLIDRFTGWGVWPPWRRAR